MPTRFGFVWRFERPQHYRLEVWDRTEANSMIESFVVDAKAAALRNLDANVLILEAVSLRADVSGDDMIRRAFIALTRILDPGTEARARIDLNTCRPPFHFHPTAEDFPEEPQTAFDVLEVFPQSQPGGTLFDLLADLQTQMAEAMGIEVLVLGSSSVTPGDLFALFCAGNAPEGPRTFDEAPEAGVEPTENRQVAESLEHAVGLATSLHDDHVYDHDMTHARDNAAALRRMVGERDPNPTRPITTGAPRGNVLIHRGNSEESGLIPLVGGPLIIDDPHAVDVDVDDQGRRNRALEWYRSNIGIDMAADDGEYSAAVHTQRDSEGRVVITRVTRTRREPPSS